MSDPRLSPLATRSLGPPTEAAQSQARAPETRRALKTPRDRRAFTLVELLIAMLIGLVVVAGLYNLFTTQTKQFLYQDLQMEMHQNGRLAADVLGRTARVAGFGTAGSVTGVLGWDGSAGDEEVSLPAIISYDASGSNGSDAITLVSMDPGLTMATNAAQPPVCDTSELSFDASFQDNAERLAQLDVGELIMCVDYTTVGTFNSYLWPIAAVDSSTGQVLVTPAVHDDYINRCAQMGNLPMVLVCSRAEVATFYIDADDTDGIGAGSPAHPVLMMDLDFESPDEDDIPVVDHIEDLQIEYCVSSGPGNTDCSDSANWRNGLTVTDVNSVYMVRFTLVVRSSRQDPQRLHPGAPLSVANNAPAATPDNYFRQALTTEVTVRNLRMQALINPTDTVAEGTIVP